MVRDRFPMVEVIENHENLGVATARNKTMRIREGDFMALLDDDLEFREDSIAKLVQRFDDFPDAAVVSPKLLYANGELQLSCRTFQTVTALALRSKPFRRFFPQSQAVKTHLMEEADHDVEQFVDWTLGACHVIQSIHLDRIGLLDEGYFYLYEDVDFCFRAQRLGLKVLYSPVTEVIHHYQRKSARSFNKMTIKHAGSIMRYFMKHRNFF